MAWWFYLVAIPAAAFIVNGIPHFVHGVSGERFPSPFSGGPGTTDSALRNVLWGAGNLIVGAILLWTIRRGLHDLLLLAELAILGTIFAAFFGYIFAHPERFGRRR